MLNSKFKSVCITGNFRIDGEIRQIYGKQDINPNKEIIKKDSALYLVAQYDYKLIPLDDYAEQIVANFSEGRGEDNSSIYDVIINGHNVIILLYLFNHIVNVPELTPMYLYLDRLVASELDDNNVFNGLSEIDFLKQEFNIQKSILLLDYFSETARKTFLMYGPNYRATVERDHPGVYRIKNVVPFKTNNRADQMVQFFGAIKFVTFDEAVRIDGSDVNVNAPKTHAIFKAWEEFTVFERAIYDNEVKELGFVKYDNYSYDGEEIVFHFSKNLSSYKLFSSRNVFDNEYDVFSDFVGNDATTISDLIAYRKEHRPIRLFTTRNESLETKELRFEIPNIDADIISPGYIILSDRNIASQESRRLTTASSIESKKNNTTNMILRLSAGNTDFQRGDDKPPLNDKVVKAMFGDEKVDIKENFKDALYMAINTPDIALIQGPPGTGKTTLITGIVSRLQSFKNKHYKILISSEQHDALQNAIQRSSSSDLPVYVTSTKYDPNHNEEEKDMFNETMIDYQENLLNACDKILSENKAVVNYSQEVAKVIVSIKKIKSSNYSKSIVNEQLENITQACINIGCYSEVRPIIESISTKYKIKEDPETDPVLMLLKRKLGRQITNPEGFYSDNGLFMLNQLEKDLRRFGYEKLLMEEGLYNDLVNRTGDKTFKRYMDYVLEVKEKLFPSVNEFELQEYKSSEMFDTLIHMIHYFVNKKDKNFYDIVENLKFQMSDLDNVKNAVMRYSNIIGSTCAQADRSVNFTSLNLEKRYDYVIIDEAARANPLDLMIPVSLGTKVIMVGDQMQLPHYIESKYVNLFKKDKEKYSAFDENLLTKSLFEIIYDSLEDSWNKGKLKFKRHIRINEQHRMHPIIGNFISQQFYTKSIERDGVVEEYGGIQNGINTVTKINDYNVYHSKNIVWENMHISKGCETRNNSSLERSCEAEKVIEIIKQLFQNNPKRMLNIGIITFYKGQVELINNMLAEEFSQTSLEQITVNTVDSCQGQEFDIVILSCVRSNAEILAEQSLGFLYYSQSRINVALSRAKRLLIVIGDDETMCKSEIFDNLVDYIKKNGEYKEN